VGIEEHDAILHCSIHHHHQAAILLFTVLTACFFTRSFLA